MAKNRQENYLSRIFNGLACGYFASFVLGTVCQEIAQVIHFSLLYQWGVMLTYMMGPAISIAVAWSLEAKGINLLTATLAGAIGADMIVVDGKQVSLAVGQPLLACLAVILAVEVIRLMQDKTSFDLIIAPILAMLCAGLIVWAVKPFYIQMVHWFSSVVQQCTHMHPVMMGICIALIAGFITTSPLSSLFLMSVLSGFDGLVLAVACAGVCSQMAGLAIMSFQDNHLGHVLAVGLGTSLLQFKNIVKRPLIWLPPFIAGILSGVLTVLLSLHCYAQGAYLGLTGLVGFLDIVKSMTPVYWLLFVLVDIVLPMGVCYSMYKAFRKLNYIKSGDMFISGI